MFVSANGTTSTAGVAAAPVGDGVPVASSSIPGCAASVFVATIGLVSSMVVAGRSGGVASVAAGVVAAAVSLLPAAAAAVAAGHVLLLLAVVSSTILRIQHFEQHPPVASDPKNPQPSLHRIVVLGRGLDTCCCSLFVLVVMVVVLYWLFPFGVECKMTRSSLLCWSS